MVFNYFPIGCFPGPQAVASQGPFNYSRDELGCLREYNELIKFVNNELENSLVNINVELENINITIVDIHKFILDAIANPRSYGGNILHFSIFKSFLITGYPSRPSLYTLALA